jgi:group I intron endonuclease
VVAIAVYKITNSVNGKLYIGQSKSPHTRWGRHKKDALTQNWLLSRAIRKHGVSAFSMEILHWCETKEDANELEQFLIAECYTQVTGYNILPGGDGILPGTKFSDSHKQNISKGRMNMQFSEAHKANLSAAKKGEKHPQYGTKRSDSTRAKIAAGLVGIKRAPDSEETKLKRSVAQTERRRRERALKLAALVEV